VARREGAGLLPSLDATAGGSVSRRATEVEVPGPDRRTRANATSLSLGLAASYEVDLWGRIQSLTDAAVLDAEGRVEDLRAAAITLSARTADSWIRLVEQRALEDLLGEQIETDGQILELIELRFRRGRVPAEDVLRQRQLMESKRESLAAAAEAAETLEKELAVLLGRDPTAPGIPRRATQPVLPPLPDTGAPARLLLRRPDVRAALVRIHAADARVAAAVAARYPSLRITGSATTSGPSVGEFFREWLLSAAGSLVAPLVDGGAREADEDRARSVVRERIHDLGQVVVEAVAEVEIALDREARQREQLDSLIRQRELSEEIVKRTRDRYLGGAADYLRVLEALSTAQNLDRRLLAARRALVQDRVDLYRALAGGWRLEPPAGEPPDEETAEPIDEP
jgi:NodT family efflux transporter outer membrane factor (OMF) lipoprotein